MKSALKFQQLNSELSHMKHFHEVSKVGSTSSENPIGTVLGNVSCVRAQNSAVEISMEIPFSLSFNMGHDLFFWNKVAVNGS